MSITVTVPAADRSVDAFDLVYVRGSGVAFHYRGKTGVNHSPIGDATVYDWVEHSLRGDSDLLAFDSINVWALVMATLQVAALMLLTFEAPGPLDENRIIRYISDNIASHQGYGGVMLVSFAGSYMLLAIVSLPAWLVYTTFALVGGASFGGAGVVLFHGAFEMQHIACAACFITCALLLHIVVIYSGPFRLRHTVRDAVLIAFTLAAALVFGGVLIANHIRVDDSQSAEDPADVLQSRDPRLREWLWTSGVCEYVLYINMCLLNALVGQRVLEHTAWSVFNALPVCAARSYS